MENYLVGALGFFAGGMLQGMTGFGSVLVAIPLMLVVMDAQTAVPACSLAGLFMALSLGFTLRKHIERDKVLPIILGSVPGVVLGAVFLKGVDGALIKLLLGLVLVGYGSYGLYGAYRGGPGLILVGRVWGYLAGFVMGSISTAVSAGGPPAIIYVSMTGWKKDTVKATLSSCFVATGGMTVLAHALSGLTGAHEAGLAAVCFGAGFVGLKLGVAWFGGISEERYRVLLFLLLLCMGVAMLLM